MSEEKRKKRFRKLLIIMILKRLKNMKKNTKIVIERIFHPVHLYVKGMNQLEVCVLFGARIRLV